MVRATSSKPRACFHVNALTGSRIYAFNSNAAHFIAGPASQPQRLTLKVSDAVGPSGLRLRAFPSEGGSLVGIEQAGTLLNSDRTIRFSACKSRRGKSMDQRARPEWLARLCHGFFCCSCIMTRSAFEK